MKLKKTWFIWLLLPACTSPGYIAGNYKGQEAPGESGRISPAPGIYISLGQP